MSNRPFIKKAVSFLISLALTALWFAHDTRHAENRRVESLLHWSRQVTQQVEALRLYAREKNEPDPITWAIKYLMVGDDTRPLWIKPFYENQGSAFLENFSFDARKGDFYYSKVLNPESGQGIQLKINSEPIGFLGSRTIWVSDALVLTIFLLILWSFKALLTREQPSTAEEIARLERLAGSEEQWLEEIRSPVPEPIPAPNPQPVAPDLTEWKAPILSWIQEAKKVLMSLGLAIKAMTQEAKNLTEVVAKSKAQLDLTVITVETLKRTIGKLELTSLPPSDQTDQLRAVTAAIQELSDQTSNQIAVVLTEYENAFDVTRKLNESITQTNRSVLAEAKLFQTLKSKI